MLQLGHAANIHIDLDTPDFEMEWIVTKFIKFSEIEKIFGHMDNPDPSVKKMVILFEE